MHRQNLKAPKLTSLFTNLSARPNQACLDPVVIEAVSKYKTVEHQVTIRNWLLKTSDINSKVDAEGRNVLHIAAVSGIVQLISFFIKKELNVNSLAYNGDTPLIFAIKAYHDACQEQNNELKGKLIRVIEVLLASGAKNIPVQDGVPKSAMSVAVTTYRIEIVELLLKANFDINECDLFSPLWYLKGERNSDEHHAMVKFLKEHGAQVLVTKDPRYSMLAAMMGAATRDVDTNIAKNGMKK